MPLNILDWGRLALAPQEETQEEEPAKVERADSTEGLASLLIQGLEEKPIDASRHKHAGPGARRNAQKSTTAS